MLCMNVFHIMYNLTYCDVMIENKALLVSFFLQYSKSIIHIDRELFYDVSFLYSFQGGRGEQGLQVRRNFSFSMSICFCLGTTRRKRRKSMRVISIYLLNRRKIFFRVKKVEKDNEVFVVGQVYLVLLEWMHYHVHVKLY